MENTANTLNNDTNKKQVGFISRDEMNLAEFPLTVLSTRSDPKIKTLEFKDIIIGKNGKEINREWIITATDKWGLPTSSDDEVLLGLLKLSVDNKFQDKKVFFTRYELLKILRWSTEGKSYTRLQKALDRLSGVRIKATNAFYDNENKNHSTKNFGIIDAYEIKDGRDSNPKPSFFIWSDEMFQSFQSGFIKKLDLDFYLDLKSSVSKRLYRYLDKSFWYKSVVQMNIFTLAHEKIGISRNYQYASSIRQQLEVAIEELINLGFLTSVEFVGKGKNTQIIFYSSLNKPRSLGGTQSSSVSNERKFSVIENKNVNPENKHSENQDLSEHLSQSLINRGLKPNQTDGLLDQKEPYLLNKIKKIIEYYDFLMSSNSVLISKSPLGFLYRAVEKAETFSLPKSFEMSNSQNPNRPKILGKDEQRNKEEQMKQKYDQFISQEVQRLKKQIEPNLEEKLKKEVEEGLIKLKSIISEDRYNDTVRHGVEQKLARLFALPSFQEWKA